MRVLLDTNVWRYIIDGNSTSDLFRLARAARLRILIAPSVLYEALRTNDPELRRRLVSLMTLAKWKRLMPEAYSECQELLGGIRRHRPCWLRSAPDRQLFTRFRYDWTRRSGGFWERARRTPDIEAKKIDAWGDGNLGQARTQSRERRKDFHEMSLSQWLPLSGVRARPISPINGWNIEVEPWRADGWTSTTYGLLTKGHPYVDWLKPEVDISRMTFENRSWLDFWFSDVDTKELPRF